MTARIRLPKKLSPKPAPHLFPPLFAAGRGERERERDIIGIPRVRLPRRPFHPLSIPPLFPFPPGLEGYRHPVNGFAPSLSGMAHLPTRFPSNNKPPPTGGWKAPTPRSRFREPPLEDDVVPEVNYASFHKTSCRVHGKWESNYRKKEQRVSLSSPTRLSSRSIFGPFPKWNTFPIFVTIFYNLFYNFIE